jgi:hypothetical protein
MVYHNHSHCCLSHELGYCQVCDIVYCKKCGKEWKNTNYSWGGITYTTGIVKLGDSSNIASATSDGSPLNSGTIHVH